VVQSVAFLRAQCGKKIFFYQGESKIRNVKLRLSCLGYLDDVTAPVGRISPANDQTGFFEFVQ
jgi:hypothetical protein